MGGAYGRMLHIYDNHSLTFGEIKQIFVNASGGKLLVSEKTDGINLFLSYSVKEGKAKAARNQSNIKSGGLDAEQLASKFADRGQLTTAFKEAFSTWEEAIKQLNPQTQIKIFGPATNIFYSAEIIGPDSKNVINYEKKMLVLHSSGDFVNGIDEKSINIEDGRKLLQNSLQKIQNSSQNLGSYELINQSIQQLKQIEDKKPLESALANLTQIQSKFKLEDNQTIGEFIKKNISLYFKKEFPELTPAIVNSLGDKALGAKGLNINKILEKVPPKHQEKIKLLANNINELSKKAIAPLENIIHQFAVEILKGINSIYILDNDKSIKQLRSEVEDAIKKIQNSGHEEAINVLNQQLQKLKNADQITSSIEGFVFEFGGMTYKFTGNFAPVNQILGLFKFGRGAAIPALNKFIKESSKNRIISMFPGSFKPPHLDHFLAVKKINDVPNVDEIIVIISPTSRSNKNNTIEITANQSLQIWNIFAKYLTKVKPLISASPSPVQDVYNKMAKLNPGDTLLLLKGIEEKDTDTRFNRAQAWSDKNDLGIKVDSIYNTETHVHSSQLRELIANNKKDEFNKFIPKIISNVEKEEIWRILTNNKDLKSMQEHIVKNNNKYCLQSKSSNKNLGCYANKGAAEKREKQVQYFKNVKENHQCEVTHPGKSHQMWEEELELKEMSSGAGGSVEGSVFSRKMKGPWVNDRFDESLFINRERFLEELTLRENIREVIKEFNNKEINELRSFVRKHIKETFLDNLTSILKEGKSNQSDTTIHASTGINVLEDLLKKIIPSLEQDYKTLTTNPKQRESFKAHILNAVAKTLTAADINQQAGDLGSQKQSGMNLKEEIFPAVDPLSSPPLEDNVDINMVEIERSLRRRGSANHDNVSVKIVVHGDGYGVETTVDGDRRYPTEDPMPLEAAVRLAMVQIVNPRASYTYIPPDPVQPSVQDRPVGARPYRAVGDLADEYRSRGLSRQQAWAQYIKDTILQPVVRSEKVNAAEFFAAYKGVN